MRQPSQARLKAPDIRRVKSREPTDSLSTINGVSTSSGDNDGERAGRPPFLLTLSTKMMLRNGLMTDLRNLRKNEKS